MFAAYLEQWQLSVAGPAQVTPGSHLLPVTFEGLPAMLKIAGTDEERQGAHLLVAWQGRGAAPVYRHAESVLLMARAEGSGSLLSMALNGQDDDASRIVCTCLHALHRQDVANGPWLTGLPQRFESLLTLAQSQGGVLQTCADSARQLLATPQPGVALHGDAHHGNFLDFAPRGWLAIDPKGLWGERGFDYANLLFNPELSTAVNPERFDRQLGLIARTAQLQPRRLLEWTLAAAGLSAAWFIEDHLPAMAQHSLQVAQLAAVRLAPGT